MCAGDISNAYLYGTYREKLYVVARDDFKEYCGKVMIIVKSWYGLKTSAAAWAEHLANTMFGMGFKPSKADPNIWMRQRGEQYKYVASYVDDLCCDSHDVMSLIKNSSRPTA